MRNPVAAVIACVLAVLPAACATALTTAMINAAPSAPQIKMEEERRPTSGLGALRLARSAAVWTDAVMMRDGILEALESTGVFERTVGPALVDQKLQARSLASLSSGISSSERPAIAAQVAGDLDVDQLLIVSVDAPIVKSDGVILPNASVRYLTRVSLVDRKLQQEVWGATLSITLPNGMNLPSQREIGAALADQISIQLKAARAAV